MTLAYLFAPSDTSDDIPRLGDGPTRVRRDEHPRDEVELAEGIRAGSGNAYEAAIRAFYPWLYRVALSYVRSEATAEEVVDGVFARVWERRDALQPQTRLGVYLLVAVRRASLDVVRHDVTVRRRLTVSDADEVPGMGSAPELTDATVEHDDVMALVWRAIDALPERARLVMMLRWREHWDWTQVAEALGVSVAAAQMLHTRALKTLREGLPKYLGE